MRVSARGDELGAEQMLELKGCYKLLLERGFAPWPLSSEKVVLWVDGMPRLVRSNDTWVLASNMIYVGARRAEGAEGLADPGARLAVTVGLMSVTGHASDTGLQGLLEAAIARVVAGTVAQVVKPLASRADDGPIERMAWSGSGGVAAWVDGEWRSPVTGEVVSVGGGWTVVETGDVAGVMAEPVRRDETPATRSEVEAWEAFANREYATQRQLELGLVIHWSSEATARQIERCVERAREAGIGNVMVTRRGGMQYVHLGPEAVAETPAQIRERFMTVFRGWGVEDLPDGRSVMTWSNSLERTNEYIAIDPRYRGFVPAQAPSGIWGPTWPLEGETAVQEAVQPF